MPKCWDVRQEADRQFMNSCIINWVSDFGGNGNGSTRVSGDDAAAIHGLRHWTRVTRMPLGRFDAVTLIWGTTIRRRMAARAPNARDERKCEHRLEVSFVAARVCLSLMGFKSVVFRQSPKSARLKLYTVCFAHWNIAPNFHFLYSMS